MHAAFDMKSLLEGVEDDAELTACIIIEKDQKMNLKKEKGNLFQIFPENE